MPGTHVFVSYSQQDRSWLDLVSPGLEALSEDGIAEYFIDDQLSAGDNWRRTILSALNRCDLAILLLTPRFFSSEFITRIELPRLRALQKARRIVIVPIFLEGEVPEEFSWIASFQSPVDPKHPVTGEDGEARARISYLIGEKIKRFAFGNTPLRRFLRRRIFNWRFSGTVGLCAGLAIALSVMMGQRLRQPGPVRALSATAPISTCAAENTTSAVQLFEKGWLIARFETDQFYAVSKRPGNVLSWIRVDASGYTKGVEGACADIEGRDFLKLGFRWFYCTAEGSEEVRDLLGAPISGEVRVWAQYQSWLDGLLIYGLPSTLDGVRQQHFQVLSGVFLRFSGRRQGAGRMFGYTTGVSDNPVYCSAIWHPARPGGRQERHQAFIDSDYCAGARIVEPDEFLAGQAACALDGYPG